MKRSALILFALLSMPLAQPAIPDYGRGAARVAVGERRVALVIGNSGYRHINHLDNPGNDARLIAKTLKGLGFQLVGGDALLDLDRPKMEAAVQAFGRDLGADSVMSQPGRCSTLPPRVVPSCSPAMRPSSMDEGTRSWSTSLAET